MKIIPIKLCFISLIMFISHKSFAVSQIQVIRDYNKIFIPLYNKNSELRIAIRIYEINNIPYYLAVNPYTFATESLPASKFTPRQPSSGAARNSDPGYFNMGELQSTPYMAALLKNTSPPYRLENYGVTHSPYNIDGIFLTIDMCPSTRMFEKDFFDALKDLSMKRGKPLPMGLAISGLWIIGHPKAFAWLLQQQKANRFKITWINHSYSHLYFNDLELKTNFLLAPQTNEDFEILETERILLQNHLLPSVYFRFPGLVSNESWVQKLRRYGLIPIGSDAWIAKNQFPTPGGIVLVHGNSNEPQGIKKFLPYLLEKNPNFFPIYNLFLSSK